MGELVHHRIAAGQQFGSRAGPMHFSLIQHSHILERPRLCRPAREVGEFEGEGFDEADEAADFVFAEFVDFFV